MAKVLDDGLIEMAFALKRVRAEMSTLKRQEDSLRTQLLAAVDGDSGDGVGIAASGAKICHIDRSPRTTISRDKLEALYPDVFVECSGTTEVRTLRIDL